MAHELFAGAVQYTLAVTGVVAGFLLVILYRKMEENGLDTFDDHPAETVGDFERIALAAGLTFLSFTVYALGGHYEHSLLLIASRVLTTLSFLVMITVFYRWWGRFR